MKRKISAGNIRYLENRVEELEKRFPFKDFALPGNNLVSSTLHVARAVARGLERRVEALRNKEKLRNKNVSVYLNRLSDLMFLYFRGQHLSHLWRR